jgi:manganese transport protein
MSQAVAVSSPIRPARDTRTRWWRLYAALGPAFVAAIAYVDPGNFATNFAAGSSTGFRLLWVVLLANVVAMPVQYLAAKLGIVTGKSLPALCRELLPRRIAIFMWAQAEVVAMATDLAEFVGAALGLNLLFGVRLPIAAAISGLLAYAILALQRRGHRPFELAIGLLLAAICLGLLFITVRSPRPDAGALAGLMPGRLNHDSMVLAIGIVGATVMPHAVYLHSGLMTSRSAGRNDGEHRRLLQAERVDIVLAMSLAGLVNLCMLAVAATLFHTGRPVSLEAVHSGLRHAVGAGAAFAFAAALLASGISSSSVGTAAGQMIMDGLLGVRIPLALRRLLTMIPAVVLLCTGIDPSRALVLSQVVLSFGIPFALVALLTLTSRRSVMGDHVNGRLIIIAMSAVAAVLVILNLMLLCEPFR